MIDIDAIRVHLSGDYDKQRHAVDDWHYINALCDEVEQLRKENAELLHREAMREYDKRLAGYHD